MMGKYKTPLYPYGRFGKNAIFRAKLLFWIENKLKQSLWILMVRFTIIKLCISSCRVSSVSILVECVLEYAEIARDLPFLASNASRNLGELLSHYNSKSCQLILGAGALQTVGLKTITTTNLVLTSRSLQLILWLMPYIKTHFDGRYKKDWTFFFFLMLKTFFDQIRAVLRNRLALML